MKTRRFSTDKILTYCKYTTYRIRTYKRKCKERKTQSLEKSIGYYKCGHATIKQMLKSLDGCMTLSNEFWNSLPLSAAIFVQYNF